MRTLYHPNREEIQFSSVLYALSDQIRLQIVTMLLEKRTILWRVKHSNREINFITPFQSFT